MSRCPIQDKHSIEPATRQGRVLVLGELDPVIRKSLEGLAQSSKLEAVAMESAPMEEAVVRVRDRLLADLGFAVCVAEVHSVAEFYADGLVTRLFEADPSLAFVLCAECDDDAWRELLAWSGNRMRLILLRQPCETVTVRQVVRLLVQQWQMERKTHDLSCELRGVVALRTKEITQTNADLVALNNRLEAAKEAAEAANGAKSAFLATISHEIRTPMTAIVGYADYLLEEGDIRQAPRARIEAINTIVRNGNHLLQLINSVLDLSKIEANRVEVERMLCQPLNVVIDVVTLMRGRAEEKQLTLTVAVDGPIPESVYSDPTRLRQVLVNLIGNAIKFTEHGGVHVALRTVSLGPGTQLLFEIHDTGIGISSEQMQRLFLPFSQGDMSMIRRYGGTGLGLCISRKLAEALGGGITVTSEPGQGSTFTFAIDAGDCSTATFLTNDALTALESPDPFAIAESRRAKVEFTGRVLIAEDGPDNQRLFSHMLRKAGADVVVVDNGEAAYATIVAANHRGEPFDVVLMDMQMPVLDGYGATRRLRENGFDLPIIALTAFAMIGDREKCLNAGCTDYLAKPIDRSIFLPTVAKYVEQSTARRFDQSLVRPGPAPA